MPVTKRHEKAASKILYHYPGPVKALKFSLVITFGEYIHQKLYYLVILVTKSMKMNESTKEDGFLTNSGHFPFPDPLQLEITDISTTFNSQHLSLRLPDFGLPDLVAPA